MGTTLILNGSPRAPRSNSKLYSGLFRHYARNHTDYRDITRTNHSELCRAMGQHTDTLLVFPLYADSLPVGVLDFLKALEADPPHTKPVISVLINCGFLEASQNETAIRIIGAFCRRNGYRLGSILMLGSGEAILRTPFRYVAVRAIRRLVRSIEKRDYKTIRATMPIGKRLFRIAADIYWTNYGKRFGVSKEQMRTMDIEKP